MRLAPLIRIAAVLFLLSATLGLADPSIPQEQLSDAMRNAQYFYQTGQVLEGQKIIGGKPVPFAENHWQVALIFPPTGGKHAMLFCGGSIIAERWVLTAAHCVDNKVKPSSFRILSGSADLYGGQTPIEVDSVVVHPDWEPAPLYHNDLALVHLKSPVPATLAVPLPASSADKDSVGIDAVVRVTGWGAVGQGGPAVQYLRGVDVSVVSNDDCNDKVSYNGDVTPTMVCAGFGPGGKDSCQGDSGGPLTKNVAGTRVLAGIVSWGRKCGEPDKYGVYTRVAAFVEWINGCRADAEKGLPATISRCNKGNKAMQHLKIIAAAAALLSSSAAYCAEASDPTVATGLQVSVGKCIFTGDRSDTQQRDLISAVLSAGISQGVNLLGKALTNAGAAKTWHVQGARNFQASKDLFPSCIQIARGSFYKAKAEAAWLTGTTASERTQHETLVKNGLFLAQTPDFFFEGLIVASGDGSSLAIRPVRSIFAKAIGSRALRGNSRSIALFLAITPPGTKPSLDTAPAATIVLGKQAQGTAIDYYLPATTSTASSPFESSWFSLSRDQAQKPFTITAMLSETQDEDQFLTFLGGLLSDDTVKSKATHAIEVLAIPSVAQADAAAKAKDGRTADNLDDQRYGEMIAALKTCANSPADSIVENGALAKNAMRAFMEADSDPNVSKPKGTVTDVQLGQIDLLKPATIVGQCSQLIPVVQ